MSFLGPLVVIVYTIIVVYRPGWSGKYTVYFWKYTAHHINQPAQKKPAPILEVE